MPRHFNRLAMAAAVSVVGLASAAQAGVAFYQGPAGFVGFNAAAGSPPVVIDFDSFSGNLEGVTLSGVSFSSPDGNSLDVVAGADTFTPPGFSGAPDPASNTLMPTTGLNVLSPGGVVLAPGPDLRQRDSLRLDFTAPLHSFGLDILHQSFDCCTYVIVEAIDENGDGYLGSVIGGAGGGGDPGGVSFFGLVADGPGIVRITFSEFDDNDAYPDANVGYDSFRFGAATGGVPEPASWALMIAGFGLAGAALRRRAIHTA